VERVAERHLTCVADQAPEVIRVTEGLDWEKADVYAYGSTLYEMVHRKKLFGGMTDFQIMDLVVRRQERPAVAADVPAYVVLRLACTVGTQGRH